LAAKHGKQRRWHLSSVEPLGVADRGFVWMD